MQTADGDTNVYVMGDDKVLDSYQSDAEELPRAAVVKDEKEQEVPSSASSVSPHNSMLSAAGADNNTGGGLGSAFLNDIPHRPGPPYPPQMLHAELSPEQQAYVDSGNMGVSGQTAMHAPHAGMTLQEMCPNPHESGRRPPMFNPPTDFSNNAATGALYPAWSQSSAAPNNSALYSFTPQQQGQGQGSFIPQSGVSMAQSQQYLASYDGLPRTPFEPTHAGMFRPANAAAAASPVHAQGYALHLAHHDGRSVSALRIKTERPQ